MASAILAAVIQGLRKVEARAGRHDLRQGAPLHEFHDDERDAVLLADFMDDRDAWMTQRRRGAGLPEDAAPGCGVGFLEDLEGDGAVQYLVVRAVDRAEAAATEDRVNPVVAEVLAYHRGDQPDILQAPPGETFTGPFGTNTGA